MFSGSYSPEGEGSSNLKEDVKGSSNLKEDAKPSSSLVKENNCVWSLNKFLR